MVEGFALVLVLQDVTLGAGTQVAALGVCAGLGAYARWGAFVQVLAEGRVVRVDDFAGRAGAERADRCLDAAVGAGVAVAAVGVAL